MTKWISKDPLGEAGGWNLTCFCDNDPVNKYDALGLFDLPTHINVSISAMRGMRNRLGLSSTQFYDLMRGVVEGSTFPDTQTRIPSPYGQLVPVMQDARRFDQVVDYPTDQAMKGLKYISGEIGDAQVAAIGLVWGDYPRINHGVRNWWEHGPSFLGPALSWVSQYSKKAESLNQTHYGGQSWQHGMGDASMTAVGLQTEIINGSLSCMNGYSDCVSVGNYYDAGFALGKALHYLQDTYTPSHAQRDAKTGQITAFFDYCAQSPKLHAIEDKPRFGGPVYNVAVQQSQDLINIFINGSPEDIAGAYQLAPKVQYGGAGNFKTVDEMLDPREDLFWEILTGANR